MDLLISPFYNPLIAQRNLEIAASSYCSDIELWNCVHCIPNVDIIKVIHGESNVIIANDKVQNATVVAFRGSSNIDNWISNFQAEFTEPYSDKSIKVHKGLYNEYLLYKDVLFETIDLESKIVTTGHSSGGALAMFFAYDLLHKGIDNVAVYSFGKPRIGNDKFVDSTQKLTHFRITHDQDIVPHLPEEVLGYQHTNTEIWYNNDIDYTVCYDNEDSSCSNSCAPIHCVSTKDHLRYLGINIGSESC